MKSDLVSIQVSGDTLRHWYVLLLGAAATCRDAGESRQAAGLQDLADLINANLELRREAA